MRVLRSLLVISFIVVMAATLFAAGPHASFSSHVDSVGLISLPADFRATWVHLGSWVVTSTAAAGTGLGQANPGTGIHNVYTQPDSLKDYRKTARWPDGAVLVMEVRNLNWDDLPTGHVMVEGEPVKWFVMVKDAKGRFPGNPNWGDGWGWAFFTPADPKKNASTDYRNDCMGCHEPARATDWIFVQGYPAVR